MQVSRNVRRVGGGGGAEEPPSPSHTEREEKAPAFRMPGANSASVVPQRASPWAVLEASSRGSDVSQISLVLLHVT